MKNLLKTVLLSVVFSAPAYADFSGDFVFANWTLAENGGSILDGGVGSVMLMSNNTGGAAFTDFTINASSDLTVTFDWSYSTVDASPFWDPFGYLVDGTFTRLTANGGPLTQSDTNVSFSVLSGEIFGFRARSRDGILGAATTNVSNFTAVSAVPLPSSLSLLSCAFGGFVLVQRRRRENGKAESVI